MKPISANLGYPNYCYGQAKFISTTFETNLKSFVEKVNNQFPIKGIGIGVERNHFDNPNNNKLFILQTEIFNNQTEIVTNEGEIMIVNKELSISEIVEKIEEMEDKITHFNLEKLVLITELEFK